MMQEVVLKVLEEVIVLEDSGWEAPEGFWRLKSLL